MGNAAPQHMRLFYLIARRSVRSICLAFLAGVISGFSTAGLLAVINAALNRQSLVPKLILPFVLLAIVAPIARISSELLLVHLGQNALVNMRMGLSRLILNQPLRRLEELGAHRILAILIEDIPTLTGAISAMPMLCINGAVVAACLAYMGWLSPRLFLVMCGILVIGVTTYLLPLNRAVRSFRVARDEYNNLQKHFGSLINGSKELKVHRERREAFLDGI